MEQKEKFLDKCKRWKETPIEVVKSKSFLNITQLLLTTILFLATIIGGYNFLTEILILFSCFWALALFIQIVFKNKLNLYVLSSYGILVFGAAFTFITRGADDFGYRFGYNFAFSLIPIICVTLLAILPKLQNHKVSYYLTRATSFCMIVGSLVYVLFMNIRIKPNCMNLQEGHDDYLNRVKNSGHATNENPNVLLILMDDMAFSDISSYSYMEDNPTIKTPNIDSIGENGVMMDNCYASSPVSSPSRFSILTGRYSCRGYLDRVVFNTKQQNFPFSTTRFFNAFQLDHNVDGILGDEITVAEALKARGYDTGLFGKWNLGDYGEYLPTNQGFDYFYGSHYINDMIPYNVVREEGGVFKEVHSHNDMLDQSMSTEDYTGELNKWMKAQVENQFAVAAENVNEVNPFFIEYATPWPHFPIFSNKNGKGVGDKSDDNYIDCIEEFDEAIGTILDYLKATDDPRNPGEKLYDNTLVMFTSDNGPGREGVTGNLRGRKNTPFEGGYKVPFLASYPNGFGHTKDHLQARSMNIDVFATVVDFAGIPLEQIAPTDRAIDGKSMRTLWENTTLGDTYHGDMDVNLHDRIYYFKGGSVKAISGEFESYVYEKDSTGKSVLKVDSNGVPVTRMQDFKYYKNVQTENSAFFNQFYKDYLFNLDADQAEGYNIAMRNDISVIPMTEEELKEKKLINPIAKQLKQELEDINKFIKNDKNRRTGAFK